jgi:hypothetical protein
MEGGSPVACNLSNLGAKYFSRVRRQKGKEGILTHLRLYRDVCHQCATSERYKLTEHTVAWLPVLVLGGIFTCHVGPKMK